MNNTLIVYGSKYGSTKEISEKLARVMGPASAVEPSDFSEKYLNYNSVLIGSPIYTEKILPEINNFIKKNVDWLKTKKIALFTVSLSPSSPDKYFSEIIELLGDSVVWVGAFGGVMNPELFDQDDAEAIERLSKILGVKMGYQDMRDDLNLSKKALELKRLLNNAQNMPQDKLMKHIDNFLLSHNTCALCTGHEGEVRATPIEYEYIDGALYFLSEGGEKFSHLLLNPNVSVAVFDNYGGFNNINGLQITGKVETIPFGSSEFTKIATKKGLDSQKLANLPIVLNMFKVIPTCFEFLSSAIGREEYDVRQTLTL